MSKKCSTFALEIGNTYFAGGSGEGNAGVRPLRNIPAKNTYQRPGKRATKERLTFPISSIAPYLFDIMRDTRFQLIALLAQLIRQICERLNPLK